MCGSWCSCSDERAVIVIFEIRHVQNGVVLRVEMDGSESGEELVWQERYNDEVEAFAEFLRDVVEQYGPATNRYSPQRISIRIEPGDKYEPDMSAKPIEQ